MAKPLSEFLTLCQTLDDEEFPKRYPWPFLVHSSTTGIPLKPAQAPKAAGTLDRLVIEEAVRQMQHPSMRQRPVVYGVYELRARLDAQSPRISVGCTPSCDVVIDDASVSRVHAHVSRVGPTYAILDADSTAGTQVNDRPLEGGIARPLASGDRVTFGNVTMEFLGPREFHDYVKVWVRA